MPVHSRMVVSYSPFFFSGSELRETISELQTAAQCCAIEQPGVPLTWMTRQATSKRLETGKALFHLADSTFSFVSPHRRRLASNACPRYLNDTTTTFAPLPKHLYNGGTVGFCRSTVSLLLTKQQRECSCRRLESRLKKGNGGGVSCFLFLFSFFFSS